MSHRHPTLLECRSLVARLSAQREEMPLQTSVFDRWQYASHAS